MISLLIVEFGTNVNEKTTTYASQPVLSYHLTRKSLDLLVALKGFTFLLIYKPVRQEIQFYLVFDCS